LDFPVPGFPDLDTGLLRTLLDDFALGFEPTDTE
jgi:hypothetical protein